MNRNPASIAPKNIRGKAKIPLATCMGQNVEVQPIVRNGSPFRQTKYKTSPHMAKSRTMTVAAVMTNPEFHCPTMNSDSTIEGIISRNKTLTSSACPFRESFGTYSERSGGFSQPLATAQRPLISLPGRLGCVKNHILQRGDQLFCRIDHLAVNRANQGVRFGLDFLAMEAVL